MPGPNDTIRPQDIAPAGGDLARNLLLFGRELKARGLQITPARLSQAAAALQLVDVTDGEDARTALRATLTVSNSEWPVFDTVFDAFWLGRSRAPGAGKTDTLAPESLLSAPTRQSGATVLLGQMGQDVGGEGAEASYSARDVLTTRDFAEYTDADVRAARRFIRQLAPRLATKKSRRMRPGSPGEVDLRRSLRLAARRGGEVVELARRRRRVRKLDLVALCDVSGSMDLYSNFLIEFLYALQTETSNVRTFVFSTRLFEVTELLRQRSLEAALDQIARTVNAWSGGTRIGACLQEFNQRYARRLVGPRTLVIITSDGWEREDADLLGHEMAWLHRRAYRVIWLNPLRGRRGYEPLAKGMAAALPHTDYFLAAHNLESLIAAGRTIVALNRG